MTEPRDVILENLKAPTPDELRQISSKLLESLRAQLQIPDGATMLPSFTYRLPFGDEDDTVMAIDLGGSTLRIAVMELPQDAASKSVGTEIVLTDELKQLPGERFFDYIAGQVELVHKNYLSESGTSKRTVRKMGFTWSFPIIQTSSDSGKIQKMGKGFRIHEGIVGQDLKKIFEAALDRRGLKHLRLTALLNDTTATMLALPAALYQERLSQPTNPDYKRPNTSLSLICGTGVNAAILLPIPSLHPSKFPNSTPPPEKSVIVNTECSMLGANIFPLTSADISLNAASENPGFQPFEQLVSGRYLGEIVRLTMAEMGLEVGPQWSISSGDDGEPGSIQERIMKLVRTRAAAYLAAMVAALNQLRGGGEVVVACAGAVLENGTVKEECERFLGVLGGGIRLKLVEDAGRWGAAVGAVGAAQAREDEGIDKGEFWAKFEER